jgi:hypothetical protein
MDTGYPDSWFLVGFLSLPGKFRDVSIGLRSVPFQFIRHDSALYSLDSECFVKEFTNPPPRPFTSLWIGAPQPEGAGEPIGVTSVSGGFLAANGKIVT